MKYKLVKNEEKEKIAPELANRADLDIFFDNEKYWIRKPRNTSGDERKREYLGFLLGNEFANVAEVRLPDQEEVDEIKTLLSSNDLTIDNLSLVRLAQSYSLNDLKNQSLESAVARELLYSLWIRRRDAHADNRVYLPEGIPIFYDHNVAFLSEDHSVADINVFFANKPDHSYGNANWWRVIKTDKLITTVAARQILSINRSEMAYHYVNDLDKFYKELENAKQTLLALYNDEDINNFVFKSGLEHANPNIAALLIQNLKTLESDIEKMKEIIFTSV